MYNIATLRQRFFGSRLAIAVTDRSRAFSPAALLPAINPAIATHAKVRTALLIKTYQHYSHWYDFGRFQTLSSTKTEPRNLRKPTFARIGKMAGREMNCDNDGQPAAGQYCFR
jgi:hypothetical protein